MHQCLEESRQQESRQEQRQPAVSINIIRRWSKSHSTIDHDTLFSSNAAQTHLIFQCRESPSPSMVGSLLCGGGGDAVLATASQNMT